MPPRAKKTVSEKENVCTATSAPTATVAEASAPEKPVRASRAKRSATTPATETPTTVAPSRATPTASDDAHSAATAPAASAAPTGERAWSSEEVAALKRARVLTNPAFRNYWALIASQVPGRTAAECQAHAEFLGGASITVGAAGGAGGSNAGANGDEDDEDEAPTARRRMGQLTKKRLVRDILSKRDNAHDGDDAFQSTPFKRRTLLSAVSPLTPQRLARNPLQRAMLDFDELERSSSAALMSPLSPGLPRAGLFGVRAVVAAAAAATTATATSSSGGSTAAAAHAMPPTSPAISRTARGAGAPPASPFDNPLHRAVDRKQADTYIARIHRAVPVSRSYKRKGRPAAWGQMSAARTEIELAPAAPRNSALAIRLTAVARAAQAGMLREQPISDPYLERRLASLNRRAAARTNVDGDILHADQQLHTEGDDALDSTSTGATAGVDGESYWNDDYYTDDEEAELREELRDLL